MARGLGHVTKRIWNPGDPEPGDHPDVIDSEGDIWSWEPYVGIAIPGEEDGGWWLETGPWAGGDLWPWSEVTSTGEVREA